MSADKGSGHLRYVAAGPPPSRPAEASVATVAFIPPGYLHGIFAVFRDDGDKSQPSWLSDVLHENHFRFAHGIQLSVPSQSDQTDAAEVKLFAASNPTMFRFSERRFEARNQIAAPTLLASPPGSHRLLAGGGSHGRSKNGFLARPPGSLSALGMFRLPRHIPQIGISLQLWVADDGCKCVAVSHNFFPQYNAYIDGVRVSFSFNPEFEKFDAYDLPVQWRLFAAELMFDALHRLPPVQRYPGRCLAGWYSSIAPCGQITWCDRQVPAISIEFGDPPEPTRVRRWWRALKSFLRLAREDRDADRESTPTNAELEPIWATLTEGATAFVQRPAG